MESRKIDSLIAEHVMEKEVLNASSCTKDGDDPYLMRIKNDHCIPLPAYSTSIEAAFSVVEKFGEYMCIHCNDKKGFVVVIPRLPSGIQVEADTAPMAICLAALRSKNVKVDDV